MFIAPFRQSNSPFFGEIWTVGVDNLVVLACVLRATTKERSSAVTGKISKPPEKILATRVYIYAAAIN